MQPSPNGLMPSYEAACDLYRGDPAAVWKVGLGVLSRAAVIGVGLSVVAPGRRNLARDALAASLAVETFVLAWVWYNDPEAWAARQRSVQTSAK